MTNESIILLDEKINNLLKIKKHNQYSLKKLNILMSVRLYLVENKEYINEIANILSVSSSSVQRYLNDIIIEEELGYEIKEEIKEKLKQGKIKGNSEGGIIYSKKNIAIKDKKGRFMGSKSK